jgi:hypothetical protein
VGILVSAVPGLPSGWELSVALILNKGQKGHKSIEQYAIPSRIQILEKHFLTIICTLTTTDPLTCPLLGIRNNFVRIRILRSVPVPLTNESGFGSGMPKNMIRSKVKEKSQNHKSRFFFLFLLDDGRIRSRSRSWIRSRIRTCD